MHTDVVVILDITLSNTILTILGLTILGLLLGPCFAKQIVQMKVNLNPVIKNIFGRKCTSIVVSPFILRDRSHTFM
jgi:hypothetical protein